MPYLLAFGLLIVGYTILDWGYQRLQHRNVSMWSLVSGQAANAQASASPTAVGAITGAAQGAIGSALGIGAASGAATAQAGAPPINPSQGVARQRPVAV